MSLSLLALFGITSHLVVSVGIEMASSLADSANS